MKIYISNISTVVTQEEVKIIIRALNHYLLGMCKDWEISTTQVFQSRQNITDSNLKPNTVFIMNDTDDESSLGYHYELDGIAIAKVFAKTILDYGGVVLYSDMETNTVSQCICHEILELMINPTINKWYMDNYGDFWAGELSDPVQGNIVLSNISGTNVALSDYILPKWFSPDSPSGPFNKLNTLNAPFTVDLGGYAIKMSDNDFTFVYGSRCTPDKIQELNDEIQELKMSMSKKSV